MQPVEDWIDSSKQELPLLNAKLRARAAWRDHAGAKALQRQIDLIESIIEHHRMTPRIDLERSDLSSLLEAMDHGIQHCAQIVVEAQEDNQLTGCLVALTTINRRMRELHDQGPW